MWRNRCTVVDRSELKGVVLFFNDAEGTIYVYVPVLSFKKSLHAKVGKYFCTLSFFFLK